MTVAAADRIDEHQVEAIDGGLGDGDGELHAVGTRGDGEDTARAAHRPEVAAR